MSIIIVCERIRMLLPHRIAGLALAIGCLAGCDGGEGSAPATGGAGIPGVRGPASPKTNAFARGSRPGAGPNARRAAPATASPTEGAESEKTPSVPQ